jgi:hypothetical protein
MTRQRRGQKVRPERDQAADCERARELLARLTELLYRIGHPRAEEVAGLIEAFDTNAPAAWRALDGNAWWAGVVGEKPTNWRRILVRLRAAVTWMPDEDDKLISP